MKICIFLLYLIVIFLISMFFYLKIHRKNLKPEVLIQKCKVDQNKLRLLLNKAVPCLELSGIIYWLSWGTLLGYVRHNKKMIPWDIDIDLAVLKDENFEKKICMLKSKLKTINCKLIWYPIGYRIVCNKTKCFLDIYLYHDKGEVLEGELYSKLFYKNHEFQKNQVFPLFKDIFEGVTVNIPCSYLEWLKKIYGKDCLEKKIISQGKDSFDGLALNFFGPIHL